jgi:hypothetical protein
MKGKAAIKEVMVEDRTARLTILIDPDKKKAFEDLCTRLDTTPSQAIRQMIRLFLTEHNVIWTKGNGHS